MDGLARSARINRAGWSNRAAAALALLIPGCAGLAYLATFGAPATYLYVNAGALLAGVIWAAFGTLPSEKRISNILMFALVAMLGIPLLSGPQIDGISRWLPLGGFKLHIGLAVIPLIAVLSARDQKLGNIAQLSAMLLAMYQPDPASALAIMLAALGIAVVNRHPNGLAYSFFAILALGIVRWLGNLPPRKFVEGIIPDLIDTSPLTAIFLSLSLVASVALILAAPGADRPARLALAGSLAGFILASLLGDYPTPLIGYGAAAIVGLGLALPALRERS